jgi:hypothetical protein
MNLATWVVRHGLARPDHPAIADGDRVHATWQQFAARARPPGPQGSTTTWAQRPEIGWRS